MKYSVFDLDNLGLIPHALASSARFKIASNKSSIASTVFTPEHTWSGTTKYCSQSARVSVECVIML
jgi:hypothetical protein